MLAKKKRLIAGSLALTLAVAFVTFGILLFQGRLPLRTLAVAGQVDRLRFSPDGRLMAAVVHGKNITVWDARTWQKLYTLPGAFESCYFMPDSRSLITSSIHGGPGAEAVNRGEGLTIAEWKLQQNNIQGRLQRWNLMDGQTVFLSILPLGGLAAAAPEAGRAVFLESNTPSGLSMRDTLDGHQLHFLPTSANVNAYLSPNSHWLAVLDRVQSGGSLTLWNTKTWQRKSIPMPHGIADADFSPDGQWFEASSAQSIAIWRVSDWHQTTIIPTNYDDAGRSQFSLDSKQIIADGSWRKKQQGAQDPNTALEIWDVATGRKIALLRHQYLIFWRLTSRGLTTLEIHSIDNILWNTTSGQRIWEGYGSYYPEIGVSPDGHTLLTAHMNSSNQNEGGVIQVRHLP